MVKDYTNLLNGLTQRPGSCRDFANPTPHSPHGLQNRILIERFTPASPDAPVQRVIRDGNIAVTWGLNNLVERIATSTFAYSAENSGWVQAMAVGIDSSPAFGYSDNSLNASTHVLYLSQASLNKSDAGVRTLEYQGTFIDTATPYLIAEVGLFGSQGAGGNMVAASTLASTDQVNKGTGDTVNISYQLIFASA